MASVSAGELGGVESLYLAIRTSRLPEPAGGADVLAELGPEALDFALAVLPGRIASVHATGGALFREAVLDTVVLIIAAQPGAVATIELSRCLPSTIPTTGLGEVEIEVIGRLGALRITPYPAVMVTTDHGVAARPLLDVPNPARSGPIRSLDGNEAVQAALAAARLSLTRGVPVDTVSLPAAEEMKDLRP
ncbi:hypothetical protein [uncultured Enterovirga sp.]|uniref:Gfo/Idh/MocA family protein n=1 Tax=uncultured Enterovirga sp. TaxID=2026352 RepID=UPI0035CB584B